MFSIILIIIYGVSFGSIDKDCLDWFAKSKISPANGCFYHCNAITVSPKTDLCPLFCDELCKLTFSEDLIFKLSDLYPGLTLQERSLAASEPNKTLKAFKLAAEADEICKVDYPTSDTNDASDACRHFVWAALLNKELGKEFAKKILDAHEQNPSQPKREKDMDLANNKRGLDHSDQLIRDNAFDDKNVMIKFREDLKANKLIVIKSKAAKK